MSGNKRKVKDEIENGGKPTKTPKVKDEEPEKKKMMMKKKKKEKTNALTLSDMYVWKPISVGMVWNFLMTYLVIRFVVDIVTKQSRSPSFIDTENSSSRRKRNSCARSR